MRKTLGPYILVSQLIPVTNHQSELLNDLLYFDEIASAAEDSGKVLVVPRAKATKGKISIPLVINKET